MRALEEMADILELTEANFFQVMAYRNGAQNLDDWEGDLDAAIREGSLREIPGIGKGLSAIISDLRRHDRSEECDRLRGLIPATLRELLAVPRLGPKRITRLHKELGVDSLDSLESAARDQRIRNLRGFGAKTEERILQGIDRVRRRGSKAG